RGCRRLIIPVSGASAVAHTTTGAGTPIARRGRYVSHRGASTRCDDGAFPYCAAGNGGRTDPDESEPSDPHIAGDRRAGRGLGTFAHVAIMIDRGAGVDDGEIVDYVPRH